MATLRPLRPVLGSASSRAIAIGPSKLQWRAPSLRRARSSCVTYYSCAEQPQSAHSSQLPKADSKPRGKLAKDVQKEADEYNRRIDDLLVLLEESMEPPTLTWKDHMKRAVTPVLGKKTNSKEELHRAMWAQSREAAPVNPREKDLLLKQCFDESFQGKRRPKSDEKPGIITHIMFFCYNLYKFVETIFLFLFRPSVLRSSRPKPSGHSQPKTIS